MPIVVDFAGERYAVADGSTLTIGREADLEVDDNPFLHRRFLLISERDGLWWLTNIGSLLTATVADAAGGLHAWLAPGARLPLVVAHSVVMFTAGPTTYELDVYCDEAPFDVVTPEGDGAGATTHGPAALSPEQRMLLLALSEPMLRNRLRGAAGVPSSSEAAARLGWTLTKFNRKLDSLCQKLERRGVRGLHGGPARMATDRKARLVEYALAARLVSPADLGLLDAVASLEG